jgi:hypothetical protein
MFEQLARGVVERGLTVCCIYTGWKTVDPIGREVYEVRDWSLCLCYDRNSTRIASPSAMMHVLSARVGKDVGDLVDYWNEVAARLSDRFCALGVLAGATDIL